MADKDYDPKSVIISWNPVNFAPGPITLNKGIVDGTFVNVARNVPVNILRMGGDGESTRIKANNQSGLVTVTLRAGADANQQMSTVLSVYEGTGLGNVGGLMVQDFSGTSIYACPNAFIQGWEPKSNSSDAEDDIVWIFECPKLFMNHGSNKALGT